MFYNITPQVTECQVLYFVSCFVTLCHSHTTNFVMSNFVTVSLCHGHTLSWSHLARSTFSRSHFVMVSFCNRRTQFFVLSQFVTVTLDHRHTLSSSHFLTVTLCPGHDIVPVMIFSWLRFSPCHDFLPGHIEFYRTNRNSGGFRWIPVNWIPVILNSSKN